MNQRLRAGISFVVGHAGEHKYLARINEVRLADQVSVRVKDDRIAHASSVGYPTNAPQVVSPGYNGSLDFRHYDHARLIAHYRPPRHPELLLHIPLPQVLLTVIG